MTRLAGPNARYEIRWKNAQGRYRFSGITWEEAKVWFNWINCQPAHERWAITHWERLT